MLKLDHEQLLKSICFEWSLKDLPDLASEKKCKLLLAFPHIVNQGTQSPCHAKQAHSFLESDENIDTIQSSMIMAFMLPLLFWQTRGLRNSSVVPHRKMHQQTCRWQMLCVDANKYSRIGIRPWAKWNSSSNKYSEWIILTLWCILLHFKSRTF